MRTLTGDPSFLAIYRDEEKMQEEQTVVEKVTLSVRRHPRRQDVCSWDVIWEFGAGCVHLGASLTQVPFTAVGLDEITKGLS